MPVSTNPSRSPAIFKRPSAPLPRSCIKVEATAISRPAPVTLASPRQSRLAWAKQVDVGFEREISAETSRRAGRACRGQFMVPDQVFLTEKRAFGDAVMNTTIVADLVPNVHRPDLFIDKLRSSIVVGRLGRNGSRRLVGTIDIPRQTGSASVQWLAEDASITDTALAFDDVNLTPKTVAAIASYTRRSMINAVP